MAAGNFRLLASAIAGRLSRYGLTFDGKRDLSRALGYKPELTFGDYRKRYKRGGLPRRIVRLPVDYTWQRPPVVYENEDPDTNTDFESALAELVKRTRLWSYLRRADRLSRIGSFSVLFLGFDDGAAFDAPVEPKEGLGLAYLSLFSEENAKILQLEKEGDRTGLPLFYEIDFGRAGGEKRVSGRLSGAGKKERVHWSRVLHVIDDPEEDDVYGTPALEAGWNLFDDLAKVIGGTAEAAWKNAVRQTVYSADKDATFNDDEGSADGKQALATMNQQIEELEHGLKAYAIVQGITPNVIPSAVPDPTGSAAAIVGQIAGTYGYPQRILLGSERGNLSSSQDRENMASLIRDRQTNQAEPLLVRPLLDRLIEFRVLPQPKEYGMDWPDPMIASAAERASVAHVTAQAAEAISRQALGARVIDPNEFRESIGLLPLEDDVDDEELEDLEDESDEDPDPAGNGADADATEAS